jgi:hypothetical protein
MSKVGTVPDTTTGEAIVRARHAELAGQLAARTSAVLAAARANPDRDGVAGPGGQGAREHLQDWCSASLLPHIVQEEHELYSAASEVETTRLLTCGLLAEHQALVALVAQLALARDPFDVAVAAASLQAVFTGHLAKEDDLLLPALIGAGIELPVLATSIPTAEAPADTEEEGCGCGHDHATGPLTLTIPTRAASVAPLAAVAATPEAGSEVSRVG